MESNLTFRELEDTIDPLPPGQQRTRGPEVQRSPLMSYINQTTRDYRSEGGRDAVNMSIGRNIFLEWKVFFDKYGHSRHDMNDIVARATRNRYLALAERISSHSTSRPVSALSHESATPLIRYHRERCKKLMDILEYEERMGPEPEPEPEPRAGKPKKKRKSKKKSKRKSKKKKTKKR